MATTVTDLLYPDANVESNYPVLHFCYRKKTTLKRTCLPLLYQHYMNTKADLKAAREAIGAKNYSEAVKACKRVLLWDSANYNAYVFMGVGYTNLEEDEEAEEAYQRAIEINSETMLAWQGLISFYEKRGKHDKLAAVLQDLLPKAVQSDDGARVSDYLNKLIDIYQAKDDHDKYIETLKYFLPGSKYYDVMQKSAAKTMRKPLGIWKQLVEITEKEQAKLIENRINSRRFSVNAGPPGQIKEQVETEVYSQSTLDSMYENMLDLMEEGDEEERRSIELKLLAILYKRLPAEKNKTELYNKMIGLCTKLVQEKVHDALPYEIYIELSDADGVDHYDKQLMDIMVEFTDTGLGKLMMGYGLYMHGEVDRAFDMFGEGLELSPSSLFGYQCLSWIYYDSKEYETGLEYATKGRDLVRKKTRNLGQSFDNVMLSMERCMAHCYRFLDVKYYPDALDLYRKILAVKPEDISALEGTGIILFSENNLEEALSYFERVYELEPSRYTALAEIGWIRCEQKDYTKAIEYITKAIELSEEPVADYHYRLGRVYWAMGGKEQDAFTCFMQAVKLNPLFGSAFTYLGHYYRTVKNDPIRAKKCYQKAFVLEASDVDAALHLSDYYVADGEMTEAEDIFEKVTELCPKCAWAWRRLGFAKMNANLYGEAITCFQKSLRNDTSDVRCWEGLAEAYAHEGRFVAALKAFGRATDLDPSSVHANYQKSLVKQKVGLLDEAILGFKETLALAEKQGQADYLPAIKGLADTYLERVKEEIQQGFFARAASSCGRVIQVARQGLERDEHILGFWKLIGDACAVFHIIPTYLHLCAYAELQQVMQIALKHNPHTQLGNLFVEQDPCASLVDEFVQLDVSSDEFYLPPKTALDVVLACAGFAYKQALILCKNHHSLAPAFWHDIALLYHWATENNLSDQTPDPLLSETAMRCVRMALKMEPTQYLYWNTLGVISLRSSARISQYAFVKAMEFNNRSAVPWTNYGFLCLSLDDYELANQAFETAHVLDPEWISAWVGQAYVASLWKSDAGDIFQHAFESSYGSSLEASYGYAESVFNQLSTLPSTNTSLVISPAFALQKLTERKLHHALALNLMGLLLERLGQYERASEAFAGSILALEAQTDQGLDQATMTERVAKVHANLGRTLTASGDYQGALSSYLSALEHAVGSSRTYCQLGAGIAYYFEDQLEDSLGMFEAALNDTQEDASLRLDVTVLLGKVLWALGGDEQRAVAKEQLFASIADNPTYLPAIFCLCAMGMLQEDETLTDAALQELAKIPMDVAAASDKDHWISWLFSRYHQLQDEPQLAMRSLAKSVKNQPWMAVLWSRLASHALQNGKNTESCGTSVRAMTSAALTMATGSKSTSADAKAEAYEMAAQALILSESKETQQAKRNAQRAVMTAPWRYSSWKTLAATTH